MGPVPARLFAAFALALATGCGGGTSSGVAPGPTPTPSPSGTPAPYIYVANFGSQSITVFNSAIGGSGVAPVRTIAGAATGLLSPRAIAVDATGRVYVANLVGPSNIEVFADGSTGNVAPVQTIQGSATTLNIVYALALDTTGQIAASNNPADITQHAILFFSQSANGNVAPTRSITGGASVATATGIAFDSADELLAALQLPSSFSSNTVLAFAANASGAAAPLRTLSGSLTLLDTSGLGGSAPAIAAQGTSMYVAIAPTNALPARVLVFPVSANGNVAPAATIQGSATTLSSPQGIAVDSAGYLYVLDASGTIAIFAPGASGNVAPLRSISIAGGSSANAVAIAVGPP